MSLHSLLAVVKSLMMILALFMLVAGKRTPQSMKISQHSLLVEARREETSETYFSLVEAKISPFFNLCA